MTGREQSADRGARVGAGHWQSVIRVWRTDGARYAYRYDPGTLPADSTGQMLVAQLRALADDIERTLEGRA